MQGVASSRAPRCRHPCRAVTREDLQLHDRTEFTCDHQSWVNIAKATVDTLKEIGVDDCYFVRETARELYTRCKGRQLEACYCGGTRIHPRISSERHVPSGGGRLVCWGANPKRSKKIRQLCYAIGARADPEIRDRAGGRARDGRVPWRSDAFFQFAPHVFQRHPGDEEGQ